MQKFQGTNFKSRVTEKNKIRPGSIPRGAPAVYLEKRLPKYSNTKQTYEGYSYMSRKEAQYANLLDEKLKFGQIKSWARQQCIPIVVNGLFICNYYIDFVVTHNDNEREYVEVKGLEMPLWKMKWLLVQALHPEWRLTVIK